MQLESAGTQSIIGKLHFEHLYKQSGPQENNKSPCIVYLYKLYTCIGKHAQSCVCVCVEGYYCIKCIYSL